MMIKDLIVAGNLLERQLKEETIEDRDTWSIFEQDQRYGLTCALYSRN
jgi:hypothetical protein